MPRIALWICLLLAAAGVQPSGAQEPLAPGVRVRLQLERGWPTRTLPVRLEGLVATAGSDTLVLGLSPGAGEARVPYSGVRRLEVSRGAESRLRTLLEGAVDGALFGAALGALAHQVLGPDQDFSRSVATFSASGAAWGALRGLFTRRDERWVRIPVPAR